MVDLAAGGFDAGIRLGQFIAPNMVAVKLTPPVPFVVVGSPDYFARHGQPEHVDDLRHHTCLRLRRSNGAIAPWSFAADDEPIEVAVAGPLIAHDYPPLIAAAVRGIGLTQAPGPLVRRLITARKLKEVLIRHAAMTPGVFLYHPGKRQVVPKLRAFIDHIRSPT